MWRSNQDGISNSNTAPQLVEAVIIDSNCEEHPKNKANQKELPQFRKYFTKNKDCQGRSDLIYSQVRPWSKLCMFILCVI